MSLIGQFLVVSSFVAPVKSHSSPYITGSVFLRRRESFFLGYIVQGTGYGCHPPYRMRGCVVSRFTPSHSKLNTIGVER